MKDFIFTSESVTEAHPDKMCDVISDAVVDAVFAQDPHSRCAVETFTKTGFVLVGGELTTTANIDVEKIVRETVIDIGYDSSEKGFDGNTCGVLVSLGKQSPDIARGVDRGDPLEQGAGDQGMVFGYACNETPELMPLPISLAHRLAKNLAEFRKKGRSKHLVAIRDIRPDGKTQVSVQYENGKPKHIANVVLSTQHSLDVSTEDLWLSMLDDVINPTLDPLGEMFDDNTEVLINPTGRFVIGGPMGDSGLTGRKIIVDTYGGMGRHGGGAFSGKDPSKVDRSAAYYARYIAKHVVAAGLASRCEVQIAYAIGVAKPVSLCVNTFGTNDRGIQNPLWSDERLASAISKTFDARPGAIREELFLYLPIFKRTAAYGHLGREPEPFYHGNGLSTAPDAYYFPWERTPKIEELLRNL